jgi:excisionase family DNA binding protein
MTLLTTIQAAKQLGISPRGVQALVTRGVLPASQFGRALAFAPADVARVAKRPRAGAGGPRKTKAISR